MASGRPARNRPLSAAVRSRGWLRPLCLLITCVLAAATLVPYQPSAAAPSDFATFEFGPTDLLSGNTVGVELDEDTGAIRIATEVRDQGDPAYQRVRMVESAPFDLAGPSRISKVWVEADTPHGAAVEASLRGCVDGRWTEWRESQELAALDGATAVQARLVLFAAPDGSSPRITAVRGYAEPTGEVRAAQIGFPVAPSVTLMATRIGLVGRTTANGHVVAEHDRFVALPSKRALNANGATDYLVQLSYRGRTVVAPVWDIGPWNINDDYWNDSRERYTELPRWTSQAEAAFFHGHNSGRDGSGRTVILPNSIDLADGTFLEDLGMTQNDWIDVTFLWVTAPSPPRRAIPSVTPKTAQPSATQATSNQTAPPSRAAGYNAPMPSTPVFLPLITSDPNGWTTSWTVQNPSGNAVSGVMDLYDAGGTLAGQLALSLEPWGSDTFTATDATGIGSTFIGSAVIKSSGPVAAIVNDDRAGSDRMAYEGIPTGAAILAAPLVVKSHEGWSSGIQVQNLGASTATVRVDYASASGGVWQESASIPPMATRTFFQSANPSMPRDFVGSAIVQSVNGHPLAVVVAQTSTQGGATAYPGAPVGAQSLYAPVLYNHYNGWDSGIQIQNLNPAPTRAVVTYQTSGQSNPAAVETVSIPGGGSVTLYQPAQPQLPDGWVGSARIVGDRGARLAGVVSEVATNKQAAMNYVLGNPPVISAAAPLITKGSDGWNAGIQVQNPGMGPSGIVVTLYEESGVQVTSLQETIEAGGSRTYYPPTMSDVPPGFRGSAIIQSVTGQPVAVVVNETAR